MSLLNYFVASERAIVCVDTQVGLSNGGRYEQSKLLLLPHANVVLACRGTINMLAHVFCQALSNRCSFDSLAGDLPEMLKLAAGEVSPRSEAAGWGPDMLSTHELVAIGWSDKYSRFLAKAHAYNEGTFAGKFMGWGVAPSEPFSGASFAPPEDAIAMHRVAVDQVNWMRANWDRDGIGGEPIAGGRLIVAQLTRDRAELSWHAASSQPLERAQ